MKTPVFGPREDAWLTGLEQSGWHDAFRLVRGTARAYTWYSPNGGNGFRLDKLPADAKTARSCHQKRRGGVEIDAAGRHHADLR